MGRAARIGLGLIVAVLAGCGSQAKDLTTAVSLSAERSIGTYPDLLPAAKHVRTPSLSITSRNDGFTNFGRDTRQLHRATPRAGC